VFWAHKAAYDSYDWYRRKTWMFRIASISIAGTAVACEKACLAESAALQQITL